MALDDLLMVVGASLFSSATGMLVGGWVERRRIVRQFTVDAQSWLDQRTSARG